MSTKKNNADVSTKLLIAIGALLIIAACGYYLASQYADTNNPIRGMTDIAQLSRGSTGSGPTGPDYVPVSVDMKGWKTYSNTSFGIKFSYPAELPLAVASQQVNNLVTTVGDDLTIDVRVKPSNFSSLENSAKALAALSEQESQNSATLVTIHAVPTTIGHIHGYTIIRAASDALRNTDATFEAEAGNYLIDFNYSYQGYILDTHPENVLAGGPETPEFKTKLAADQAAYNDVQGIISTLSHN